MSDVEARPVLPSRSRSRAGANAVATGTVALIVMLPGFAAIDSRLHGIAAFVWECGAILLCAAAVWQPGEPVTRGSAALFLRRGANAPVLSWLGVVMLSCLLVARHGYGVQEALRQVAGVMVYLTISARCRRHDPMRLLADGLLVCGMLISISGFCQYSGGAMATGFYHDHELCGSCLAALLPFSIMLTVGSRETNRQLAAQASTGCIGLCLLLTHARSAWLGALAGTVALAATALPAILRHRSTQQIRSNVVLAGVLALMVCATCAAFLTQAGSVTERIATFSRLGTDQAWSRRLQAWDGARRMIARHPMFGVGIGAYPIHQQRYTHLSRVLDRDACAPSLGEQAHNLYLQTAAEVGIPALAVFLSIFCVFLAQGAMHLARMAAGLRKSLLQAAMASVVTVAVDAGGSPAWQCGQISIFFWVALGLGVACMVEADRHQPVQLQPDRGNGKRLAIVIIGLTLFVGLPSVTFSARASFPDHVQMEADGPQEITVRRPVVLRLWLVFTDGSRTDVTRSSDTEIIIVGPHRGALQFSDHDVYYLPASGENDLPVVTGIYRGAQPDLVAPKDRAGYTLHVTMNRP